MIELPKPVMTPHDVIDFVVDYFGADTERRSRNEGGLCAYRGTRGRLCAFALFVSNPEALVERIGSSAQSESVRLRAEVQHLPYLQSHRNFWLDVQCLHDRSFYWRPSGGLTESGVQFVQELKKRWSNG